MKPVLVSACFLSFTVFAWAQPSAFVKVDAGAVLVEKGPPVLSAAFSKDGKLLACGGVDGGVQIWDVSTRQKSLSIKAHFGPVYALAFTPDGKHMVSGGADKLVKIWELAKGAEAGRLDGFKLVVLALAVSPDGKTLLASTGQFNKIDLPEIKVFDLQQRSELASLKLGSAVNKGADALSLAFAPDGKTFAAAVRGDGLQSWDLANREKLATLYEAGGYPAAVAFALDGLNVAAGCSHGQIVLVDARTWKKIGGMKGHKDIVTAVSLSADGRTLASACRDATAKLWDVSTLEVPAPITLRNGNGPASIALFSPADKTVAAAGYDGKIFLHEVSRSAAVVQKNFDPITPATGFRLALVGTERGPAIQNLLDLAEVKLSGVVQVLERRELDALLTEQKLSLAGFVKHDQIVQAGKLLGVDLFAVIEADKRDKQAVGLVIFNAQTGVRLWDATLPSAGAAPTADAVASAVRSAVHKQQRFGLDLGTICLTTVRNADLPRAQDALCDLVGQLLERGLVSAPNLALLERTRLDQVIKEQNLPTDSPLGKMLASLVRIELEVGKAPDGKGLRGTAFLVNNRDQELGKATAVVAEHDAAALAAALVAEVAKPLKAAPGKVIVDRVREVLRLNAEADFFQDHKDWVRCVKARQAACALKPDDVATRARLAGALIEAGRAVHGLLSQRIVIFAPPPTNDQLRQSLELMRPGVEALLLVESAQPDPALLAQYSGPAWYNLVTFLDAVNGLKMDEQTRGLLEKVQDANLVLQEMRQQRAFQQVNDEASYEFYTALIGDPNHYLAIERRAGLTDEQYARYQEKLLVRWLDLAEQWGQPPLPPATTGSTFHLLRILKSSANAARGESYRQKLLKTQDAHVLLHDRQMELLFNFAKLTEAEKQKRVHDFRLFVQDFLASDKTRASSLVRLDSYQAAVDAINSLFSLGGFKQPRGQNFLELCRFMMAQKELMPKVIQHTVHAGFDSGSRVSDEARFTLINQLLGMVDSARLLANDITLGNPKFAAESREQVKKDLLEQRQQIVARHPDLERKIMQPWPRLETLVDLVNAKVGIVRLIEPMVYEGHVYVVGVGQAKSKPPYDHYLELMRFSLQGGEHQRLGRVSCDLKRDLLSMPPKHALADRLKFAASTCIHDGRFILGTRGHGIAIFTLSDAEAAWVQVDNGLPSNYVQQLDCLNGKVVAGLGEPGKEGYLIAYDLKSTHVDVLASSRRKDTRSALDNTAPLQVFACRADPQRQRVLAYVWLNRSFELRRHNGLWEIDGKSGQLRQLHSLNTLDSSNAFDLEWASPIFDDKLLLALRDATCLVDLMTNKLERIELPSQASSRLHSYLEPRLDHLTTLLKPGLRTMQLRSGDFFHDGSLYTSQPFGRTSLDGTIKEAFPNLREPHLSTFQPWEAFRIAGHQILIADQHGMWVARLPKNK